MQCTFQVGDKVTPTIEWPDNGWHLNIPTFGTVYTVRKIEACADGVGIQLHEIVNAPRFCREGGGTEFCEPLFHAAYFRRVISTDISDLQKIARDVFEGERELLPMGVIR